MKIADLMVIAALFAFSACSSPDPNADLADTAANDTNATTAIASPDASNTCQPTEHLIYDNSSFSTYTEDKIRGKGVVSITLNVNDRLEILNDDDSVFGFLVLNEDMTFYLLDMPKRVVARRVVPEYDVAAFDFDADEDNAKDEYLHVYVNKERKAIKKAGLDHQYYSWPEYIKTQAIALKPCNKLKNARALDPGILFDVTAVNGDEITIRSSKDCGGEDAPYAKAEGTVKWRKGNELLVELASCN